MNNKHSLTSGAAPRFWRWGTSLRAEQAKKNFLTPPLVYLGGMKQNIAQFLRATALCNSAYMLSPISLSVCQSHGWIIKKRLKLGLWNFHHMIAPSL